MTKDTGFRKGTFLYKQIYMVRSPIGTGNFCFGYKYYIHGVFRLLLSLEIKKQVRKKSFYPFTHTFCCDLFRVLEVLVLIV